jgi:hypothetical protein
MNLAAVHTQKWLVVSCGTPDVGLLAASGPLADVAEGPIVLQKSFLGAGRKFLGPLMRFVCGEVRDHTFLRKTTTEFRIGAAEYCSCGVG